MGQIVLGILYGCEVPDCVEDYEAFDGMYDNKSTPLQFRTEPDGDKKLMGFFLLVAHDVRSHRGAQNVNGICVPIAGLWASPEYAAAVKSWDMLAVWWKKTFPNANLSAPTLWLAQTEVA